MTLTKTQINILRGATTVLVLFPPMQATRYSTSITFFYTSAKSSVEALRSDWIKIGADIHKSLEKEINDGQSA